MILYVCINVPNAQAGQPLLVCESSARGQKSQCVHCALRACRRLQAAHIAKPRVVVVHEVAVKGVERGRRGLDNRPTSVHKAQQHVNSTSVSMPPFLKWRWVSMSFEKKPVLSAQELSDVHRADALYRQCLGVAVVE